METKYFVCIKSVIHYPKEAFENSNNSFVNSVSWSTSIYYTTWDGGYNSNRGKYYELPYNFSEFTAGQIYTQSPGAKEGAIYLYDNHSNCIDIVENGLMEYFIELKIETDEKTKNSIKKLEEKGFKVEIRPVSCSIHDKKINLVTYYIRLTNDKLIKSSWFNDGSCMTTDIFTGLMKAMKFFKLRSNTIDSFKSALKGHYMAYANNKYQEKLKMEAEMTAFRERG